MIRKLLLFLFVSLVCAVPYSQGKSGFAAGAGYALMPLKESAGRVTESVCFNGVQLGADYAFRELPGPVGLTVGLWYFFGTCGHFNTVSEMIHDIQMPLDLSLGAELGPVYAFLYAGPSFAFNVEWVQYPGGVFTSVYSTLSGKDFNRFDIKLGGGAGLVFNDSIRLKIGYRAGVLNGCRGDMAKYCTMRRSQFTVSLAYCF